MSINENDLKGMNGNTNLHLAVIEDNLSRIKAIIALSKAPSKDINEVNAENLTPLHFAALLGRNEAAKILIDKGADINAQANPEYGPPLYIAVKQGNIELTEDLFKHNATADFKDAEGKTVVDYVKQSGNSKLIQIFGLEDSSTEVILSQDYISAFEEGAKAALLQYFPHNEQGKAILTFENIDYSDGSYSLKGKIKGTKIGEEFSKDVNEKLTAGKDSIWKSIKHFLDLHKAKESITVTYSNQDAASPQLHFKGKIADRSFEQTYNVNAEQNLIPVQKQHQSMADKIGETVNNASNIVFETAEENLQKMATVGKNDTEQVTEKAGKATAGVKEKLKHTYEGIKDLLFGKEKTHFHFERKEIVNQDGTHEIHQNFYEKNPDHTKEVSLDGDKLSNIGEKLLKNPGDSISTEFDKIVGKKVKVIKEVNIHIDSKHCHFKDIITQDSENKTSIFDIKEQDIIENCDHLQLVGILSPNPEV